MSVSNQFTPAELAQLIAGETVSKVESITPANKNADSSVEVPAEQKPQAFTPATSVPINSRTAVSRPNIKDNTGKRISSDDVVGPSAGIFDHIDEDLREAREAAEAQDRAQREIKKVASPASLLNRLNAQHRQIEQLKKDIAALKKGAK